MKENLKKTKIRRPRCKVEVKNVCRWHFILHFAKFEVWKSNVMYDWLSTTQDWEKEILLVKTEFGSILGGLKTVFLGLAVLVYSGFST